MDLSSLERAVNAREIALDSIEGLITVSTVLVVVGLVIEYWFPLGELIELIKKRPPIPWKKLMEMVGGVLVTVGVAGELWFQSRASSLQTFIRSDSHQIEGILNKEAGDARGEAGNANKEAGVARKEAANTALRAGKLEIEAAQLRKDAVGLQRDVAEARSMAASADLARAELEERIAPRTLVVAQREYIGKALGPFARQFFGRKVKLDWSLSEVEPTIFAIELEDSIKRAGIEVERPTAITLGGDIKIGVAIRGPARDVAFIRQVYFLLHIDFPRETLLYEANQKYDGSPVTITIGVKTPLGIETLPAASAALPPAPPKPTVDRHLTAEQKSIAVRQLLPFAGERMILLITPGDREAAGIATDIDAAFGAARWFGAIGKPPLIINRLRGILIEVGRAANDRDRNAADWLVRTLKDANLDVIGPVPTNENTAAPITVMIGHNP